VGISGERVIVKINYIVLIIIVTRSPLIINIQQNLGVKLADKRREEGTAIPCPFAALLG
jgi:hypothetical protein